MHASNPLVSICIPVYNMYPYVIQTIKSANAQTYKNLEIVVMENASKDKSREAINRHFDKDPRVSIFYNEETLPIYENWNACVKKSKGEFFMVLNADDILSPVFIENSMFLFDAAGERVLGYVFSEWDLIDMDNRLTHRPAIYHNSGIIPATEELRINLIGSHSHPSSMLVSRALYEEVGGYENELGIAADMHFKLKLNLNYDVGYLDYKLWYYRRHPGQETSARNLQVLYNIYEVKKDIYSKGRDRLLDDAHIWEVFHSKFEGEVEMALSAEFQRDLSNHSLWKDKFENLLERNFDSAPDHNTTFPQALKKVSSLYPLPANSVIL